jgi:hypothetical protein
MANATAGPCINYSTGKSSHIVVIDAQGRFTSQTDVKSVVDTANSLSWDVKKVKGTSTKLKIKLKGKGWPSRPNTVPPDAGSLTITLTDPTVTPPTVDPMPVDYVDDAGA